MNETWRSPLELELTEEVVQKMALSVEDARKALGVGRNTMLDLIKSPDFPVVRIGRRVIIPVSALESWLLGRIAKQGEQR